MIDERALSHGAKSSNRGERGITKRLDSLAAITPLTGDRLLDIGCADGTYTERLAAGFRWVDGIDVEPDRLTDFEKRFAQSDTVLPHHMSADDLGFADRTFDMVTAIEVLEHVAELDRTLYEVNRVLKTGGKFCVTTPNRWFPFETHGVLIRGKRRPSWAAPGLPWIPPLHRRMSDARAFTRRGLARQAGEHGLVVVGGSYIMPPFDRNAIGRRIRPVTDWVEQGPLGFLGMAHVLVFEKR